jgi:LPS O-antigen subunit length determinant protein (WzzB/FepE family)
MRRRIDDYLAGLGQALRQRRSESARLVDEAREHLADAVEDGQRRGLSEEEAERQALDRFGALDVVMTHIDQERDPIMDRFPAFAHTVWQRKWWILAPTLMTALVTSLATSLLLPTRYRSESNIRITSGLASQLVPSRSSLEQMIDEFDLYQPERNGAPIDDVVDWMRKDIAVTVSAPKPGDETDAAGFNVSFISSDPALAKRITERLAGLMVEQNLRDREARTIVRIMEPARLPEQPIGPSRLTVSVAGAFVGLALGLVMVGARGRSGSAV